MPAAEQLGVDPGVAAMAIAYGEAWMNMAQPFWALPALAIAGLGARDIMGYCVTTLIVSGFIFAIGLTFFNTKRSAEKLTFFITFSFPSVSIYFINQLRAHSSPKILLQAAHFCS